MFFRKILFYNFEFSFDRNLNHRYPTPSSQNKMLSWGNYFINSLNFSYWVPICCWTLALNPLYTTYNLDAFCCCCFITLPDAKCRCWGRCLYWSWLRMALCTANEFPLKNINFFDSTFLLLFVLFIIFFYQLTVPSLLFFLFHCSSSPFHCSNYIRCRYVTIHKQIEQNRIKTVTIVKTKFGAACRNSSEFQFMPVYGTYLCTCISKIFKPSRRYNIVIVMDSVVHTRVALLIKENTHLWWKYI